MPLNVDESQKMWKMLIELLNLVNFEDKGDYIMVKPRQYLGAENFAKIAQIIRGVGGDYVSAGKDSHFRVPKQRS